MEASKQLQKVVVKLFGHEWPVYPLKCRGRTIYRVFHRVDGQRKARTFKSVSEAKNDARSILRELYGHGAGKIHLTDEEKRDWQAALTLLKRAKTRTSLESAIRHYCDLVTVVGHASLLTDVVREYNERQGKNGAPIKLARLRDDYLEALKKRECSERHIEAQRSHTGQFIKRAGDLMSDQTTREVVQDFLDSKKDVDARTKKNLLDAIKAMMNFGKSQRCVPREWDEADHVVAPVVKSKTVRTYTPDELKRLLAAAPFKFQHVLALAAFAAIRSSELELLDWKHIRLLEKQEQDRIIKLDTDVTEEASKRSVQIPKILRDWLAAPYKRTGRIWTGTHDDFYRMQQQIAKDAGLKWQNNALRHTCISAKVAITRNVPTVAYESGNSVAIVKRHYLDLMTPSQAEAWFAITTNVVGEFAESQAKSTENSERPAQPPASE
jgi:integrase